VIEREGRAAWEVSVTAGAGYGGIVGGGSVGERGVWTEPEFPPPHDGC